MELEILKCDSSYIFTRSEPSFMLNKAARREYEVIQFWRSDKKKYGTLTFEHGNQWEILKCAIS